MELSPRTAPDPAGESVHHRRSPWAYGVLLAVLLGLGVVVYQGLTSASLYFYNADEAVSQRADLGDRRFRLQGTVLGDSIVPTDKGVRFTVAFDGVRVKVHHDGDPPELFQAGIPVVLEGHWAASGAFFASDTIRVKHSAQYQADNGDRLVDAKRGGTTAVTTADSSTP
ncbi:MAG: cytochrome c maturation protein CcmE [Acidimicrobiales bacterium]